MSLLTLAWMAFIPFCLVMLASWLLHMRTRDAGTVHIASAFGTGAVGVWFALAERGEELTRQFLVAALAAFWGMRPGTFVMLALITRMTGVPYTEYQSIRIRRAAYEEYQRTTPMFFSRPPRTSHQTAFEAR